MVFLHEPGVGADCFVEVLEGNQDLQTSCLRLQAEAESGVRHWPPFLTDDLFLHEPEAGANGFVEVLKGNQGLQD